MTQQKSTQKSGSHLIGGIVVLTIGVLFLFRNFDILGPDLSHYIFSWKTLLIGIGILNLTISDNKIAGFILISIGTFFWLPEIFELSVKASQLFWPVIIIIIGVMLLFKNPKNNHPLRPWERRKKFHNGSDENGEGENTDSSESFNQNAAAHDYVEDIAIFSGTKKTITSSNFRGGRLTAIFGGSELNLSRARLAPGRNVLDVFFMFGGSEIIVPSDWNVAIEVTPIFGGFSDERYVPKQMQTGEDSESVLVIRGLVVFGGAELKSY
ncbi:MAG: hypothetical protein GQ527_07035 [Bacteroidales bacterium]|nr:hypothetical protein [Bacteroidales bacterium]